MKMKDKTYQKAKRSLIFILGSIGIASGINMLLTNGWSFTDRFFSEGRDARTAILFIIGGAVFATYSIIDWALHKK